MEIFSQHGIHSGQGDPPFSPISAVGKNIYRIYSILVVSHSTSGEVSRSGQADDDRVGQSAD
jgi:hypothetical protein